MVNGARPASLSDRLRLIQWGAVAIGVIVDIVSSVMFAVLVGFVAGFTLASRGMSQSDIAGAIAQRMQTTLFLVVLAVVSFASSALGGFAAAKKAGELEVEHGVATGTVSLAIGVILTLVSSEKSPVVFTAITFLAAIPAAAFGAWLTKRRVS